MTQEKFKSIIDEKLQHEKQGLAAFKKRLKAGEVKSYETELSIYCSRQHLQEHLDQDISIDELKDTIKEFETQCKQHKKKLLFKADINLDACEDSIDTFALHASWYEPYDEDSEILISRAKAQAKSELYEDIRSYASLERNKYFTIDCKMVELWISSKIDFDTLASISTANCKL